MPLPIRILANITAELLVGHYFVKVWLAPRSLTHKNVNNASYTVIIEIFRCLLKPDIIIFIPLQTNLRKLNTPHLGKSPVKATSRAQD